MSRSNKHRIIYTHLKISLLSLFVLTVSLLMSASIAQGLESLTVTGSLFSEPLHHGLSESNGHPGVALSIDYEFNQHFYAGVNGYRATDARPPNRSENYNIYLGAHWGAQDGIQYDLTLIHRSYPGDFAIKWDFSELQFDVHVNDNFSLSLSGAMDYYGLDEANSLAISGNYVHDFTDQLYATVQAGTVRLDGDDLDSYEYLLLGGGYRLERFSFEILYATNNADENLAFSRPQIRDAVVANLNWLIF